MASISMEITSLLLIQPLKMSLTLLEFCLVFSGSFKNTLEVLNEIQTWLRSNQQLADYRAEILPEVCLIMSNWIFSFFRVTTLKKKSVTSLWSAFSCRVGRLCRSHFQSLGMIHELLVHQRRKGSSKTACKAFYTDGSQWTGFSSQFHAFLRNKGIDKIPLIAFHGNWFNMLIYGAAALYF